MGNKHGIPLYHYTDENGVRGILNEMRIGQSVSTPSGRDAAFGSGVYLTSISPKRNTKTDVVVNNYDGAVAYAAETDEIDDLYNYFSRTDKAFKIYMRPHEIKKAPTKSRDVYLTTNGDIDLRKHKFKVVDGPSQL